MIYLLFFACESIFRRVINFQRHLYTMHIYIPRWHVTNMLFFGEICMCAHTHTISYDFHVYASLRVRVKYLFIWQIDDTAPKQ